MCPVTSQRSLKTILAISMSKYLRIEWDREGNQSHPLRQTGILFYACKSLSHLVYVKVDVQEMLSKYLLFEGNYVETWEIIEMD